MKAFCRSLVVLCALFSVSGTITAQSGDGLFYGVPGVYRAALNQLPGSRNLLSRTVVGMRLDHLFDDAGRPAHKMALNLGGHNWVASLTRLDPADANGFRSWVGTLDGLEHSHVVFTERHGVVSGLIHGVSVAYQIRTIAVGMYALEQVDVLHHELPSVAPPVPSSLPAAEPVVASDDGSRIDVMVLYTPAAANDAGGAAQITGMASQIVSDMNTIFQNSGVVPRMRLVASVAYPHVEFGLVHVDLQDIANSSQANTLRNQFGADLVHVLLSNADLQNEGSAWLMTPALQSMDFAAYSASRVNTVATFRPQYQMGFSLGSNDAPEDGTQPGYFTYSRAYKSAALGFRTMMAAACAAPAACPRINQFSNPALMHLGNPTGTETQNNASSINNVAVTIANLRQEPTGGGGGPVPPAPTGLRTMVSGMDVALLWDGVVEARSYALQIGTAAGMSNVFDGNVGNILRFNTSLGVGTYYWRVYAINPNGPSLPSNEGSISVTTTCGVATAPLNLRASVSGDHVFLTWEPPVLGTVSTYLLEAGSSSLATNLYNGAVGPQTMVRAFVPQGVYFVRVRAQNGCGTSLTSNEVFFTVGRGGNGPGGPGGPGIPSAPQDLRLQFTGPNVTVSWNLAPGALAPTAFIVEAGSGPGLADLAVVETSGHARSYTTLRPSRGTYYVRVRARNGASPGPATPDLVLNVP